MAIRIQLRHDTSANWELNNPTLREGEFGIETDTLKIKVGPVPVTGDATAWSDITNYVNLVPSDFNTIINGYVEANDIGSAGGVVGLNNSKNAIIPGASIIIEGPTNDSYETTLTVTDPTADRTLTLPDVDGTLATEGYVDTAIAAFDALPTQTGNNGKFLQTNGSATSWATVDLSTKQDKVTGVSDTEIGYLDGVTSAIQTQLNDKQPKVSGVSDTEIGYLDGVTSAIQTQINTKAPISSPVFTGGISITDGAGLVSEGLIEAYGGLYVSGNTTIDGDLLVNGVTTSINTSNTSVADNMIYLNEAITYTITDATGNGTNQVYTTSVDHDLTTSMVVRITGMNPSGYNKSSYVEIIAVTADSFTVLGSETGTFVAGGEAHGKSSVNPDLGLSGGYNDGTYHHAGLFRDASDGTWKFFQGYDPEPSGAFIDTSDASFALAPLKVAAFEASSITVGDVSNTEIGYLNGVTSSIQDQLDDKAASADIAELAQDAIGNSVGNGLKYTDSTGVIEPDLALSGGLYIEPGNKLAVDGYYVTFNGAEQTLSNKTISGSSNTLSNIANSSLTNSSITINGSEVSLGGSATIDALPSQTGEDGKYLTTDGTTASWATLVVPIVTGTATVSQNTATAIDTTALSAFTSIEYMVSLKQGSKVRTSKVLVQTDGTSVDMTEFAIVETGGAISGVAITAVVASSDCALKVTATDGASTNVAVKFSKVAL